MHNKHYIRTDYEGNIIYGFTDAFEQPLEDDILVNEGGGRHFELLGQVNPPLKDEQGVFLFRYAGGEAVSV